ncbi:MAG: peptide/nickel transport system permease protein [Thermomicrobiales bacterium]|jgi:peptide/nickel transport system permease protein|nr:peptide/nickel transport system permease protein [Thermomicrobiales bacterium]MEA2594343.1 peptide/nickel transport system permease protein [Thermomicrobiales bacterium]
MAAIAQERLAPTRLVVWGAFKRVWSHFLLRRIAKALFTVYFVSSLIFFLVRLLPGSPVEVYINNLMSQYGYSYDVAADQARSIFSVDADKPLALQYVGYLKNVARGDLGESVLSPGVPVTQVIFTYLWWTLFSVGIGLLLAFTLGVVLGMVMAYRRNSAIDNLLSVAASLFHSVPSYLFGIMVIVFFGIRLDWIPIADMRGALSSGQETELSFAFVKDALYHASLPILTYTLTGLGAWMLLMKSSTIAALDEDFVTAARARGLSERRIAIRYVGRNAILPLFTQLTIAIGFVVGGSFLVEPIFQYQGIGYTLFKAIQSRDYPLLQGIFLMITISVVVANLVADLLYSRLDPRIRTSGRTE